VYVQSIQSCIQYTICRLTVTSVWAHFVGEFCLNQNCMIKRTEAYRTPHKEVFKETTVICKMILKILTSERLCACFFSVDGLMWLYTKVLFMCSKNLKSEAVDLKQQLDDQSKMIIYHSLHHLCQNICQKIFLQVWQNLGSVFGVLWTLHWEHFEFWTLCLVQLNLIPLTRCEMSNRLSIVGYGTVWLIRLHCVYVSSSKCQNLCMYIYRH